MKLSKRAKKIVMISAAAVAVVGLGTSTAMAAGNEGTNLKFSFKDATGIYQYEENRVRLADTGDNGMGVRAYVQWVDGKAQLEVEGEGEVVTEYLDIEDGTKLRMKLCLIEDDEDLGCSDWETAIA